MGKACPFTIQNLQKLILHGASHALILTLKIGPLTNFGLLFPAVVCQYICVFDPNITEQPYRNEHLVYYKKAIYSNINKNTSPCKN